MYRTGILEFPGNVIPTTDLHDLPKIHDINVKVSDVHNFVGIQNKHKKIGAENYW